MYLKSHLRVSLSLAILCVNFKKDICYVQDGFSQRYRFVRGFISWCYVWIAVEAHLIDFIRTINFCLIGGKNSNRELYKKITHTRQSQCKEQRCTFTFRGRAKAFENFFHTGFSYILLIIFNSRFYSLFLFLFLFLYSRERKHNFLGSGSNAESRFLTPIYLYICESYYILQHLKNNCFPNKDITELNNNNKKLLC